MKIAFYYQKGNDIITYGMRLISKKNRTYGFGQSLVLVCARRESTTIYKKIIRTDLNYDGENWIDKSAEE